jgi:predicted phosphohydrolase
MKVQYCSDLHLEFPENRAFIKQHPLIPVGEILLLAGDILPFALLNKPCDFFDFVSDNYEKIYWIPGNHEYYQYDMKDVSDPLNEKIKENLFLVDNQSVKIKDVNFIFSTLWSHIGEQSRWKIQQSVSDFFVIKNNGSNLTALEFNELHKKSLTFLETALSEHHDEKNVVVTHHVPTLMNYPEQYKSSPINEAFAVELFELISNANISNWIYGHHHANTRPFNISNTQMLTNQLGYVRHNENKLFQRDLFFEI